MMNNATTAQPTTCASCGSEPHRGEHLIAGLTFDPADLVCADCADALAD